MCGLDWLWYMQVRFINGTVNVSCLFWPSTGTKMLVIFASDGNGFGRGFKAQVTSEKRRPKPDKAKKKAKVTVQPP